jgi:hypothetical protein
MLNLHETQGRGKTFFLKITKVVVESDIQTTASIYIRVHTCVVPLPEKN